MMTMMMQEEENPVLIMLFDQSCTGLGLGSGSDEKIVYFVFSYLFICSMKS